MKQGLVITTIAAPNAALKQFAAECKTRNIPFWLMGDAKSPRDFSLPDCHYWSIEKQKTLPFALQDLLPENSYARKNLGYLLAIQTGCDRILESDDDNFPTPAFFENTTADVDVISLEQQGWVNIYHYFSDTTIWPRGLPLNHIKKAYPPLDSFQTKKVHCPIQQGLADDNPDVDAIYRLTQPLPIQFSGKQPVALGAHSWCPFNTQATVFFRPAFPLLYLPSTCNARLTDIWKSFVAQRIAWANDWHILFRPPTVWQERNEHNLMTDFAQEVEGYLQNETLCRELDALDLKAGEAHIPDNMLICYDRMIESGYIQPRERLLLQAWLEDITALSPAAFTSFQKPTGKHVNA